MAKEKTSAERKKERKRWLHRGRELEKKLQVANMELEKYKKQLAQRVVVTDHKLNESHRQLEKTYKELKVAYEDLEKHHQALESANKALADKINTLTTLEQIGMMIRTPMGLNERLKIILRSITVGVGIDRAMILLVDEDGKVLSKGIGSEDVAQELVNSLIIPLKKTAGIIARSVLEKRPYNIKDALKDRRVNKEWVSRLGRRTFATVPLVVKGKSVGVIIADNSKSGRPIREEDVESLMLFANECALAIDNAQLYERILDENVKNKEELNLAYTIQKGLLPHRNPRLEGVNIRAKSLPAKIVGGDFYYFKNFRKKEQKVGIAIGDIAGKGVPAALLMAIATGSLGEISLEKEHPKAVLAKINSAMMEHITPYSEMFATVFYAVFDAKKKLLTYSTGGHNPPILFHKETDRYKLLEAKGLLLGKFRSPSFEKKEVRLRGGDKVIFYTDGIIEATNKQGKSFGLKRLAEIILKNNSLGGTRLINKVFREVSRFRGREPQHDDLTMVVMEVKEIRGKNIGVRR